MDGEVIRTKLVQSDFFAKAFHLQAEERNVYVCAHHVAITHVVPHDHATKKLHRVSVRSPYRLPLFEFPRLRRVHHNMLQNN